ncbi:MAG: ATP-grasp domain-containing protein [Candidatus Micrarchaeota archaeon]
MGKESVAYWLPFRESMTSVSADAPGFLLREVRDGLLSELGKLFDEVIEVGDLRSNILPQDAAIAGEYIALAWFGDLGSGHRREYGLEVLRGIEEKCKLFNPSNGYATAMDKYATAKFLKQKKIPSPEYVLFDPSNVEQAAKRMDGWAGVLLKPRWGGYGIGIVKIDSPADLVDYCDYMPPSIHYAERYILNSPKDWVGINIIGGEYAYAYAKSESSFKGGWKVWDRSRIGGKMLLADPPEEYIGYAEDVAENLRMSWVGVDIITANDGPPYVVDVNAFPGLYPEMYAKAGADVPKMMAEAIRKGVDTK